VINAGDSLTIDCEAQTALYNGQASRSMYLMNRGWMGFAPGVNTFSFNAAAYNSSALLTVSAQPAYI
jgi:phage-related protein